MRAIAPRLYEPPLPSPVVRAVGAVTASRAAAPAGDRRDGAASTLPVLARVQQNPPSVPQPVPQSHTSRAMAAYVAVAGQGDRDRLADLIGVDEYA